LEERDYPIQAGEMRLELEALRAYVAQTYERLLSALDSGNVPAARAILGAAILGLSQLG